jgi:lysophospholipase L1-like esterase
LFRVGLPRRIRNLIKQVWFSLIPLVLILGAGELVFRFVSPPWMACVRTRACPHPEQRPRFVTEQQSNFSLETGEPLLVYHPQLFWWPRPHVEGTFWSTPDVRTNEFGLRERAFDSSSSRRNILLVGDSVVWGSLVEEEARYSNVLQRQLTGYAGWDDVQIVNAGVVGFSSFQVLQYLKAHGLERFRPHAVVFCVCINDSWPVARSDRQQFERYHRPIERIRRLFQTSNLFLFMERYTHEFLAWATTGQNPEGLGFLYYDRKATPRVLRNTPEETEENLRRAGDLVAACGGLPIFILEDTRIQHPHTWNAESFNQGREKLRRLAQTKEWPIIDIAALTGEPWNLAREEYLLDFCHLHPRGHRIIAELLATALDKTMLARN